MDDSHHGIPSSRLGCDVAAGHADAAEAYSVARCHLVQQELLAAAQVSRKSVNRCSGRQHSMMPASTIGSHAGCSACTHGGAVRAVCVMSERRRSRKCPANSELNQLTLCTIYWKPYLQWAAGVNLAAGNGDIRDM